MRIRIISSEMTPHFRLSCPDEVLSQNTTEKSDATALTSKTSAFSKLFWIKARMNSRLSIHNILATLTRYGYFAAGHGKADASLFSQIKRLDFQSGKTAVYNFGEGYFCGEPVFAPKPDFRYNPESAEEPGWILTQVYDSHTHKNFLAVLDAEHLADGPLALIHHTHHLPFGLHGWWSGIS